MMSLSLDLRALARQLRRASLNAITAVALPCMTLAQGTQTFSCSVANSDGTRSVVERIVGGQQADWLDTPWQVSLAKVRKDGGLTHHCGGSIIHSQWILTAQHCLWGVYEKPKEAYRFDEKPEIFRIWHGGTSVLKGGTVSAVASIHLHKDYDPFSSGPNDIALIKLAVPLGPLPESAVVQLQGERLESTFAPVGACAMVTGWGTLRERISETDRPPSSPELLKVHVPIVDEATCRAGLSKFSSGAVLQPLTVCAGYREGGSDSCQGDSGGPLVVPGGPTGWTQTGIVSYGFGCARPEGYGVYVRVAPYVPWIQEVVRSN